MKKAQPKRLATLKLSAGEFNPEVITEAIRLIMRLMVDANKYHLKKRAYHEEWGRLSQPGTTHLRDKLRHPTMRNADQFVSTARLLVAGFGPAALCRPEQIEDTYDAYDVACKHIRIAQQWHFI